MTKQEKTFECKHLNRLENVIHLKLIVVVIFY